MDQNLIIVAKKFLKKVRVLYFMLRKGIAKGKILRDLNMMMKRSKIAGKAAIHSLMLHHHGGAYSSASSSSSSGRRLHYEFSFTKNYHPPQPTKEALMAAAMEVFDSPEASPVLPGFGLSPVVRQLRITDSPFQLRNGEEESNIDEAAEEFIMRFYKDLRRQNSIAYFG